MTDTPRSPLAAPGWYPDPSGSAQLRWWDGRRWTEHLSGAPFQNRPTARPEISAQTPVYNPLIWVITVLPLIAVALIITWNPVFRIVYVGARRTPTVDPGSVFTPSYFLLIGSGWLIYGVSVLLAYLDWQKLGRAGVIRPFHWAWAFLGATIYIIGRSVIVHKVAVGRGLIPVWVLIEYLKL
ncbi:DUF2510 domain-containing protein [Micrococcaceae bacterium Sec5.7]